MEEAPTPSDFERKRPTTDQYVLSMLVFNNLPEDASHAEIEPVVRRLWTSMPSRIEAMELVLGRLLQSDEYMGDSELGRLILLDDVEEAFSTLVHFALLQEIARESE
jgi:hypothetical protein